MYITCMKRKNARPRPTATTNAATLPPVKNDKTLVENRKGHLQPRFFFSSMLRRKANESMYFSFAGLHKKPPKHTAFSLPSHLLELRTQSSHGLYTRVRPETVGPAVRRVPFTAHTRSASRAVTSGSAKPVACIVYNTCFYMFSYPVRWTPTRGSLI